MSTPARICELRGLDGREVELRGWLYGRRSGGKIVFLLVRDGTGLCQCVVEAAQADAFRAAEAAGQESSLRVRGTVRLDPRAPGGAEIAATAVDVRQHVADYPIARKEHGVDFLMSHRHLWLRSPRQAAILRIRHTLIEAIQGYFNDLGFVRIDTPILAPGAAEGEATLFPVEYFGERVFLAQTGQLYLEAAAMALGRVYCFGPTFRAEKSKTRRHLTEFWMVEPEVAWLRFEGLLDLAEEFVSSLVTRVLDRCKHELEWLERDVARLEPATRRPYPRIDYGDAVEKLKARGFPVSFGDDFGGDEETALADDSGQPTLITRFPAAIKAFYMEPDAADPTRALAVDMIAPEGYGEIIGGSERISSLEKLEQRIAEHQLPREAFTWYLDVRRYGGFPHSGFGMGIERVVSWLCGLSHLREAIPYPRLLNRLYP